MNKAYLLEGELDRLFREMATVIAHDQGATGADVPRREHLQAVIEAIAEWEATVETKKSAAEPRSLLQQLLRKHFEVTEQILELDDSQALGDAADVD
jgi:hypothetical protein